MRRLLLFSLLLAPFAQAQTNTFVFGAQGTDAAKPGSCSAPYIYWATDTQKLYVCNSGSLSLVGGPGAGTVTTTGSPASGNLTKFSGATSLTNGDLSGDVTTAGTLATTLANSGVSAGSCGSTTQSCSITVDAKGRVTAQSNNTISVTGTGGGTVNGVVASVFRQTVIQTDLPKTLIDYTPPAVAGTYCAFFALDMSAASGANFGVTISYKDSAGNTKAPTNIEIHEVGSNSISLTEAQTAPRNYWSQACFNTDNSQTHILLKVTTSATTITLSASAWLSRIN